MDRCRRARRRPLLLLGAPPLLGIGWPAAFLWMPDLALVTLLVGILVTAAAAARLALLVATR